MPPYTSDWYFEKKYYDERDIGALEEALAEHVLEWRESAEKILRRYLAANPTQKSAVQATGSRFVMDGELGVCLYLLVVTRDLPHPAQCAIFVGSEEWIMRQRARFMAQLQAKLAKPGIQGVMVEKNL
jgi:hypothetical protein